MPNWLVISIVLSVVLTVVVNLVLWLFPGAGRRAAAGLARLTEQADRGTAERGDSHVRVIVPWKAMLVVSIVLTVLLNVLVLLAR